MLKDRDYRADKKRTALLASRASNLSYIASFAALKELSEHVANCHY